MIFYLVVCRVIGGKRGDGVCLVFLIGSVFGAGFWVEGREGFLAAFGFSVEFAV